MLVVNLTTTSGRLDLCAVTLWSLIHQELLPDRIDLYISNDAYMADSGIDNLPEWYDKLNNIKKIIHIKYVENTGPYRKIFPALAECAQDDILVYADDDVVYGRYWLETLVSAFNKFNGEAVVAARVRIKNKNFLGDTRVIIDMQSLFPKESCPMILLLPVLEGVFLKRNMYMNLS